MPQETNDDILRLLTDQELEELLQLYTEKCGIESFQYLLIYTQLQWNKKLHEKEIDAQNEKWISFRKNFYTHRKGDLRKNGTYVCLHQDLIQSVTFHSWEANCNELLECLENTNLIQWKNGALLFNIAPEFSESVKNIVVRKGGVIKRARSCQGLIFKPVYGLNPNKTSIPDGYDLAELQERHADLIHSLWANNKEGSLDYIKGHIQINKTIGLYQKSNNELIGWILQNEFGGIAVLQVMSSHQRKGFGRILVEALTNIIAETESIPATAWVVVGNVKSESLLQKVGYKRAVIYEWIQLEMCN
ncbi:uncharacterized protein LOC133324561 [Musca vetustissima]|uniref:uncharacterized protein LOC133324561 n=1 Tax=Musca vetustissima TaxID=27455 RepID=UPI002AB5FB31|nr:uncharacterized protein LOC133324561 [Musca vetustissima]